MPVTCEVQKKVRQTPIVITMVGDKSFWLFVVQAAIKNVAVEFNAVTN